MARFRGAQRCLLREQTIRDSNKTEFRRALVHDQGRAGFKPLALPISLRTAAERAEMSVGIHACDPLRKIKIAPPPLKGRATPLVVKIWVRVRAEARGSSFGFVRISKPVLRAADVRARFASC